MTKQLKEALGFIDARVLDRILVGTADATLMAESGLACPGPQLLSGHYLFGTDQ